VSDTTRPGDDGDPAHDLAARACATAALPLWGLAGAGLDFVAARENVVFRVRATDGRRYALRIHRAGYHDHAELLAEHAWTTALNQAGIPTPRPVPTLAGEPYAQIPWPGTGGGLRHVGLIDWIDGVPMTDAIAPGQADPVLLLEAIGGVIAGMHNQAVVWTMPPGFRRPLLDADGLIGEQPWWGSFWDLPEFDAAQTRTVREARARMHAGLLAHGRHAGNFSIIHADVLPQNVLLRDGAPVIFDFDDCAFGWHAYDLAVALIPFMHDPRFDAIAAAAVRGYRRERPFPAAEVEQLSRLLAVRLLVQLGWLHHRVPRALRLGPERVVPRAELLRPRIAAALSACEQVLDGVEPFPLAEIPRCT
jgi:Ser/Thr protein kinase RdoA (MazF antagonist)